MGLAALIPLIGPILDKVIPDKQAREKAQLELMTMQFTAEGQELEQKAKVIVAEAQGESWIQRSWRPLLMCVFGAIVLNNYLIFPYLNPFFPEVIKVLELPLEMWDLLKIGVGGYIGGRSAEKVASMGKEAVVAYRDGQDAKRQANQSEERVRTADRFVGK